MVSWLDGWFGWNVLPLSGDFEHAQSCWKLLPPQRTTAGQVPEVWSSFPVQPFAPILPSSKIFFALPEKIAFFSPLRRLFVLFPTIPPSSTPKDQKKHSTDKKALSLSSE